MVQFTYPGGRFTARATSIKYLMEWAYDLLPAQHSNGPAWMDEERYDIVAKAKGEATDEQMKLMAQALLADRFKLKVRHETREVQALVVTVGKTPPKLYPPKEGEQHSIKITPQMGDDQKPVSFHVVATRYSFVQLNQTFARVLDQVIVNQTGMNGYYDFTLDMTPDEARPNPLDPAHVLSALREQLGLTVKAQKAPVEYLAIENIERVAAGN
jgi:uncharacterized protein (TIGR03435 family)